MSTERWPRPHAQGITKEVYCHYLCQLFKSITTRELIIISNEQSRSKKHTRYESNSYFPPTSKEEVVYSKQSQQWCKTPSKWPTLSDYRHYFRLILVAYSTTYYATVICYNCIIFFGAQNRKLEYTQDTYGWWFMIILIRILLCICWQTQMTTNQSGTGLMAPS